MNRAKWTVTPPTFKWGNEDREPVLAEGTELSLITPEELTTLNEGTELFDIFGRAYKVGTDKIDDDTRGSFLAYGFKQ